jgi:hypothetical protein
MYESKRYSRLTELFSNINMNINYIAPTYKNTITQSIYDKYVITDDIFSLRNSPMKKAELSVTLNFLEVFRNIRKNYSSGIFLTFESDIYLYEDINDIKKIIDVANKLYSDWDCIHIGYDKPNYLEKKEIIYLERRYNPRGMDSILWTYNGIIRFLNYLEKIDCKCSLTFQRNYIYYYTLIIFIINAVTIFFQEKLKEMSLVILPFSIMLLIAGIINIIYTFEYVNDMKKQNCKCSESIVRDLMFIFAILQSFVIIIFFLTIISIFVFKVKLPKMKQGLSLK